MIKITIKRFQGSNYLIPEIASEAISVFVVGRHLVDGQPCLPPAIGKDAKQT